MTNQVQYRPESPQPVLESIAVRGFKALHTRQELKLRPITLLAGANSAGKSSVMQPLLLLKQTLEASFEPPELLLNGPNVKYTKAQQLLSRPEGEDAPSCEIQFLGRFTEGQTLELGLHYQARGDELAVTAADFSRTFDSARAPLSFTLTPGMTGEALTHACVDAFHRTIPDMPPVDFAQFPSSNFLAIARQGGIELQDGEGNILERYVQQLMNLAEKPEDTAALFRGMWSAGVVLCNGIWEIVKRFTTELIHLPGFRGSPERSSPLTAVGRRFSGTFDRYAASVINAWQERKAGDILTALVDDLRALGLAEGISAHRRDATQVEVFVPRSRNRLNDFISIADVGFGVSQALPVVVALHAAQPGQLVYIEEPELHLHPRAQHAMAAVLARSAQRGVRLIVETHSDLLLLGLQTLVARGEDLAPEDVGLNWFTRDPETGWSQCQSVQLDELGSFRDSPLDFSEVALDAQSAYLDASAERQSKERQK